MLPGMNVPAGFMGSGEDYLWSFATGESLLSTSLVINKPTGVVVGDELLAIMISSNDTVTFTGDSGWSEIIDHGGTPSLRLARLIAGGSEPLSYTFTASSSVTCVGHIIALRGVSYDTAAGAVTGKTGDGFLNIAGITAAGGIIIAAVATNQTATSIAHSTPTGMTKIATTIKSGSGQPGLSTFWQNVGAGATGTRTSSLTNGTVESAGILVSYAV